MTEHPTSSSKLGLRARLEDLVVPFLVAMIVRVLYLTARKRFMGRHHLDRFFKEGQPMILAAWHNRGILVMFQYLARRPRRRRIFLSASFSRDGALAEKAMNKIGIDTVRGSSSRGGTQSLIDLVKKIRAGHDVGFAPDGPKGPVYDAKMGVIAAAKMTGAPILPLSFDAERNIRLKSWDRMIVPLPFSRVRLVCGEPIFVPKKSSTQQSETIRLQLNQALDDVSKIAGDFSA